ncbi:podocalyxin-like isoform X1 [Rhincodon typus]|uniref:podocalyxin-like isoform X1 n=2 Tax=Rhincodon typus TaxID=259920 RepID=UPI00202F5FC1|nr:podocalyxin-like isoform X1 [Rhincodon typus]
MLLTSWWVSPTSVHLIITNVSSTYLVHSFGRIVGRSVRSSLRIAASAMRPEMGDPIGVPLICLHIWPLNKMYVDEKGEKLGKLLCSRLIKKGNHKGYSHCMVELSKVKTSNRRLNVDISFKVDTNDVKSVLSETKKELKELGIQFSANQEHRNELQTPSELKKHIAMVVTGSLLLLVFLSAIVYRCSQRKSHKKKDQYLTEEIQPVDNGCHDNLAMDITESEPEMQEKPSSKVNMQDNMDNWIVPMDSLTKDELEEEDTHL